jgi:hypothetical protein
MIVWSWASAQDDDWGIQAIWCASAWGRQGWLGKWWGWGEDRRYPGTTKNPHKNAYAPKPNPLRNWLDTTPAPLVFPPHTNNFQKPIKFKSDLGNEIFGKKGEKLRTMCGSRTDGWPIPCVMSDWQRCVDWFLAKYCRCRLWLDSCWCRWRTRAKGRCRWGL